MDLVVIPFFDIKLSFTHGFRTRDAHLYEQFIKNSILFNNIVFINRPTSLIEIFLFRKKFRTIDKNIIYKNKGIFISKMNANIFIIDIFSPDFFKVLILRRGWIPYIYQNEKIISKVKQALTFLNINFYSIYLSTPFAIPLCENLKSYKIILDADDNFTQHKEYEFYKTQIDEFYQIAKRKFECITCTNNSTLEYLNLNNPKSKLLLIPNGVDCSKFNSKFKIPTDIGKLKRPIIGYAGNMQTMFDIELFCDLADSFKECSFVLIGNILDKKWMSKIYSYPNIHYLGDKNYEIYPNYINSFDICIIPYLIESQHGGDPIKFYEYMACNKPIISTNIGSIHKFRNNETIFICNDRLEFKNSLKTILADLKKNRIINYKIPIEITWSFKANIFIQELLGNEGSIKYF